MTRAEAYSAKDTNVKTLFDKYNTEQDDVISKDEYLTYFSQKEIKGASGKRVAIGGKYTVQQGDNLDSIARDFGLSLLKLYENNIVLI